MPLIDPSNIFNNILAIGIVIWFGALLWGKLNPNTRMKIVDFFTKLLSSKEEE